MHEEGDNDWSDEPIDDDWPDEEEDVVPCPECGAEVYDDSPRCPVCGAWIVSETGVFRGRSVWWMVLGILGVLATMFALVFAGI